MASIPKYSGPWGKKQVQHLLKRTMFGAKVADIEYFIATGFEQAIEQLIPQNPRFVPPPINNYYYENDPDVPFGETWVNAPYNSRLQGIRTHATVDWWIGRLINQDRTITEKMILFWQNHFGVGHSQTIDPRTNYKYINTLHINSVGNFRKIIKDITVDPLMLTFLNGFQNDSRAPDENYARELMELFTLGKGPESQYTENDVKEAAKVLTGFVYDYNNGQGDMHFNRHNTYNKTFSSYFKNKVIKGIDNIDDWQSEIFGLVDMIFEKEEVSKFICRKLYRFFVNYDITENIEAEIILPLAQILRENNYEMKPTILALFSSNHFFDDNNIGSKIKGPIDYYIGMIREMEVLIPTDIKENFDFLEYSRKVLNGMGQNIGDPPNVAGWPAYYQAPFYARSWINSDTLKSRVITVNVFSDGKFKPRNTDVTINFMQYCKYLKNAEDPNKLIDNILAHLISHNPSTELKLALKKILLSNQEGDYNWSNAWYLYLENEADENNKNIVEFRLQQLFKQIFHFEEYNLH